METSTSSVSCLQGGEDTKLTKAEEENGDEYIQRLFDREISIDGLQNDHFISGSWIEEARLDAIKYILGVSFFPVSLFVFLVFPLIVKFLFLFLFLITALALVMMEFMDIILHF